MVANGGGFDSTFATSFDPTGISYVVDGTTAYALLSTDVASATPVSGTNGRELKLVLTSNNGLTTTHSANLLDAGTSTADTVTVSSAAGIADTTTAITVTAPAATAQDVVITGVEFHAGAGMLTLIAATGAFTDAFATSLKGGYTSGITYSIDGTTDVSLSAADIYSVQASNSDASVSKLKYCLNTSD